MPKAKNKKAPAPVKPVAPTPPPAPVQEVLPPPPTNLPVVYDKLNVVEYSTASERGPLTVALMKQIMGWETEKEYQKRKVEEERARGNANAKLEHYLFGENGPVLEGGGFQPVHCKNVAGEKVVCWNNGLNRSFDEGWCEDLVHTVLYGQWAGPFTIPGETINCEIIRISKYARLMSGQHQGTALILAAEQLAKDRAQGLDPPDDPKYPAWLGDTGWVEPFLETLVATGMSEDPRVLMTVDYVKPRTAADVFYTSSVYKDCTPSERKELCRMLAAAVDMLWTRTDARGYRTHPEVVGFLERHKRLLKCVEHLFVENSASAGRRISKLQLSPGQCAALCYLMACSAVSEEDSDEYRNENPPTEKKLDFSYWDKAESFWTLLASGDDFLKVRSAIGRVIDSSPTNGNNRGLGGRGPEKLAILAAAWERWRDHPDSAGPPFEDDDLAPDGCLCLHYTDLDEKGNKMPDGEINLIECADFYGIDCPTSVSREASRRGPPEPPPPTREEMERMREAADARRESQYPCQVCKGKGCDRCNQTGRKGG